MPRRRFIPDRLKTAGLVLAGLLCACDQAETPSYREVPGGDAARGRMLVAAYGCGACHRIAGVPGAIGIVGPALDDFADRTLLAGRYPNTPRHLVPFLIDPPALVPHTGMPAMGIGEAEARDIAAFLYAGAGAPVHPPAVPPPSYDRAGEAP